MVRACADRWFIARWRVNCGYSSCTIERTALCQCPPVAWPVRNVQLSSASQDCACGQGERHASECRSAVGQVSNFSQPQSAGDTLLPCEQAVSTRLPRRRHRRRHPYQWDLSAGLVYRLLLLWSSNADVRDASPDRLLDPDGDPQPLRVDAGSRAGRLQQADGGGVVADARECDSLRQQLRAAGDVAQRYDGDQAIGCATGHTGAYRFGVRCPAGRRLRVWAEYRALHTHGRSGISNAAMACCTTQSR